MEQEINLREIIEIILKGKWIIVTIILIAMLVSAIIGFFVVSPKYESNSLVRIAATTQDGKQTIDIGVYVESLMSDAEINRIIEKLELDSKKYSISSVRKMIQLEAQQNTNIMKIKVKGSNSLLNTKIANLIAYELGDRFEITAHSQNIVEYQNELKALSDNIVSTKSELEEARNQLKLIPEKQTTNQSLINNSLLQSLVKEASNASTKDIIGIQVEDETINPAYTAIQEQIAAISISLTKLQAGEDLVKTKIKESSDRIAILDNQIQQDKLSLRISERLLDGYQAVFISPAIQSDVPTGPNKLLYMGIAVILGGMIGVVIVFFRHYMRTTSKALTNVGE